MPEPIQLSSGLRAAKQDVNRGTKSFWTITWQMDPSGLKLGEAEGPGAKVSGGTYIWYPCAPISNGCTTLGSWNPPVRLTDNMEPAGDPKVLNPAARSPIVLSQGGPADIMLRRGIGGVTPEHLQPAVDFSSNNTDASTAGWYFSLPLE